jgi:hypothetical protein
MQKNKYEKIICSAPKRAALIIMPTVFSPTESELLLVNFQIFDKLQKTKGKIIPLPSYKGDARPARSNCSLGHPTSADIATAPPPPEEP